MTSVPVKQRMSGPRVRRVRPRRDFAAMEERRMRAADLFEKGVIPAEIARQVGVSHQIVSDWRGAWRRDGRDGLRGAGRAGRLPKLSRDQLGLVALELAKGAEANGYLNDLSTLKRVAEAIAPLTGVSQSSADVWYRPRPCRNRSWQRTPSRATKSND